MYADATLQPCLADMPPAQRKRFGVNVAAGDGKRRVRTEGLPCLAPQGLHPRPVHKGIAFAGKGAREARRAGRGLEGRLNEQRARAAAGIVERHAGPPGAEVHQGGGQRFPQGSLAVPGAVAAPVERLAAHVQRDARAVVDHRHADGKARARLRKA